MTQIISVMTAEYVLLASDRRLTFVEGPRIGEVAEENECKLVSLCGTTGIGYTGIGNIKNTPTHEWIAKILAETNSRDAATACRTIQDRAPAALAYVPRGIRHHSFLLAGWAYFGAPATLRPYHCLVTNTRDLSGQLVPEPLDSFNSLLRVLGEKEESCSHLLGEPLNNERADILRRNIHRLVKREIGPQETLRLLVDEIVRTSETRPTVGSNILGFCIPKASALAQFEKGQSVLLAAKPNLEGATFTYFEKGYSELQQYGPTTVCGEYAVTDVKTQNDPSREFQSSSVRILALPKNNTQSTPARNEPIFKRPQVARPIIAFEFGISVDNAVAPGSFYEIPAAIRNTGEVPIVFAQNLSDDVGQEVPPSVQGGAVPAVTFFWPLGDWSIAHFEAVSRTKFAGIDIPSGHDFEFRFGSFTAPPAPIGSMSRSYVVDLHIRFTDTILGTLLNTGNAGFHLPTNVNPTLAFRIAAESAASALTFFPARVIETVAGELISGPVSGTPVPNCFGTITDTSISTGKPGVVMGSSSPATKTHPK